MNGNDREKMLKMRSRPAQVAHAYAHLLLCHPWGQMTIRCYQSVNHFTDVGRKLDNSVDDKLARAKRT